MNKIVSILVFILNFSCLINGQNFKELNNLQYFYYSQSNVTNKTTAKDGFAKNDFVYRNEYKKSANMFIKKEFYRPSVVYLNNNPIGYNYTYNSQGNLLTRTLERSERYSYTYDSLDNLQSELKETWENENWKAVNRNTHIFDKTSNTLTVLCEHILDGNWVCHERYIYIYDSTGNVLSRTNETASLGGWQISFRYIYTYDLRGNILTESLDGSSIQTSRWTYTYNLQDNLLTKLTQIFSNNVWNNNYLISHEYDSLGYAIFESHKRWENNTWSDYLRCTNTNDSQGNCLIQQTEYYNVGTWESAAKSTYTYNPQGSMLTYTYQYFYNNVWQNSFRFTYSYNDQNNAVNGKHESWGNNGWVASEHNLTLNYNNNQNQISFIVYTLSAEYILISDVKEEIVDNLNYFLAQNYPNPFNPNTTISFSIPKNEFVTLKIYDILGKEVTTLVNEEMNAGSHTKIWNASNLSSGIYFYKLQAGQFTQTRKMNFLK